MEAPGVPAPSVWRTPEELVGLGFDRSRVVMVNEAHAGLRRSVRTRRVGQRIVTTAHRVGVRHLAMEALHPRFAEEANDTRAVPAAESGYLAQPEMRDLIGAALDLGWTLVAYEADLRGEPSALPPRSVRRINWREEQQARNLTTAFHALAAEERLLVWCGNGHLCKRAVGDIEPMGLRFRELSGIDPFAIDQIVSVDFGHARACAYASAWAEAYRSEIEALGGSAGFLEDEAPAGWKHLHGADAFIVSVDNDLT